VVLLSYVITAITGYLLGSIPTGYLVAKAKGVDIRAVGSGNIGATNVFRTLGKPAGIIVLLIDGLKGFAACAWAVDLIWRRWGGESVDIEYLRITAGLAVVLGHNYTCWLHFKGGKGIATSGGALAALVPWALIIILIIFILVFALSRFVSLGSIAAAAALPIATWLTGSSLTMIVVTTLMSVLAIYKHKANIQRLMNGTENRVGARKQEVSP
jgi:glycerol-3-phosphate acyltransferase PlsY